MDLLYAQFSFKVSQDCFLHTTEVFYGVSSPNNAGEGGSHGTDGDTVMHSLQSLCELNSLDENNMPMLYKYMNILFKNISK